MDIVHTFLGLALLGSHWVLWILAFLSIVSVAIILERALFFIKTRLNFREFNEKLIKHLMEGNVDDAKKLCSFASSFESQMVIHGLDNIDKGPKAMEEIMSSYLIGQRQVMDKGLVVLGTLGNNAPFIGLFGTVIGIIQAFHELGSNPAGGAGVVMTGVSEALVATAVGLLVAIPAVIAFNAFQRIIKRRYANAESLLKFLVAKYNF